jgi:hypothetical protein
MLDDHADGLCGKTLAIRAEKRQILPSRLDMPGLNAMTPVTSTSPHLTQRPLMLVAAGVGILLAGTAALWVHYGTAVFYEMIVAGIATCL